MAFGLGKPEKRPEDEGEAIPEKSLEGSEDAPAVGPQEEVENDSSFADSPATEARTGESAPHLTMAFRPSFLDENQQGEGAPATAPAAESPEGDAFFVSVTQDGGTEVHRFDDPSTAQAFVEESLDKGIPEEHMTAFSGRKLALKVTRRPVVTLVSGQED